MNSRWSGMSISGDKGFTLIEILLAMFITSVILAVVMGAFYVGVTAWRAGTAESDGRQRADAVMDQVYMALRSAYIPAPAGARAPGQPRPPRQAAGRHGFIFENDGDDPASARDSISWVKIGNALVGEDCAFAGVPHRMVLSMMDGEHGEGLYVRAWRVDGQTDDFDPEKDVEAILLSSAVVGFNCQMLDPTAPAQSVSDEIPWIDRWDDTNSVPSAVHIAIAIVPPKKGDKPLILERYVEIPLAIEAQIRRR